MAILPTTVNEYYIIDYIEPLLLYQLWNEATFFLFLLELYEMKMED